MSGKKRDYKHRWEPALTPGSLTAELERRVALAKEQNLIEKRLQAFRSLKGAAIITLFLLPSLCFGQNLNGRHLVFDQEFNNTKATLSIPGGTGWGPGGATTWICHTPSASDFGSAFFSGPQDASDHVSPFFINSDDGHLSIRAWFDSTWNHTGHWRSGLLSSVGTSGVGFAIANGYYEISMHIPSARGMWPAFWLETQNTYTRSRTTPAVEIDVAELYGSDGNGPANVVTICHQVVHVWSPTGQQTYATGHSATVTDATGKIVDLSKGYHRYGVLIDGSLLTFFIDGVQKFVTPMPPEGVNQPFYVLVDLAMGAGWPIDDLMNPYPQELEIAWIRVYGH